MSVRAFASCVLACLVAAAGAYAAMWSMRPPDAVTRAAEAVPPPAVSPSDLAPAAPPGPQPARVVAAPAPVAPEPQRDPYRRWSESVAVLPKDLGEMGPSLKLGLDDARNNDMAFCFRELENGGRGSRSTDFMLYIETREDAADVVEARVVRTGALPGPVIECVLSVLRGLEVKVFSAVPGHRYSYVYEVEG